MWIFQSVISQLALPQFSVYQILLPPFLLHRGSFCLSGSGACSRFLSLSSSVAMKEEMLCLCFVGSIYNSFYSEAKFTQTWNTIWEYSLQRLQVHSTIFKSEPTWLPLKQFCHYLKLISISPWQPVEYAWRG